MNAKSFHIYAIVLLGALLVFVSISACASRAPVASTSTPTAPVFYRDPTYAQITPGPHKFVGDLSTAIEVPPFAYSGALPPPVSSVIDGLYFRLIPFEGTPTPCKRCAGYKMEGGVWSLYLNKGVFKVFQQNTNFEAIGSFAVANDQVTFFNDPYCDENVKMIGKYAWQKVGDTLTLQVIDDPCSIGLRAKNLTATGWSPKNPCQPPTREAAVSDHWYKPPECNIAFLTEP
jgi:hypothetical protein